jgi:hypothetical protein
MADQDDFEPRGRCWEKTRQAYLDGVSADDVAFSVERVLKRMLKAYGESVLLPKVLESLQQLADACDQTSLWASAERDRDVEENIDKAMRAFEGEMQRLEPLAADRRIDVLLLRTARSLATTPGTCIQPEAFITRALSDVARHCCLDEARVTSVGRTFASDAEGREQAHLRHRQTLERLLPGVEFLARQYLRDPSGQHLRCRPRRRPTDLYSERLA